MRQQRVLGFAVGLLLRERTVKAQFVGRLEFRVLDFAALQIARVSASMHLGGLNKNWVGGCLLSYRSL